MRLGKLRWIVFIVLSVISLSAAYGWGGNEGLAGAALGVAFAAVLVAGSSFLVHRARRVEPRFLVGTMLLGALAVLVAMALFVWSVRDMSREGILGATLTAAVLYIVHRLFQAFDLTGGRPAPGRFE